MTYLDRYRGIYVIRTSLDNKTMSDEEVVSSYKSLWNIERVFRGFNTDLPIRPIRHETEEGVRCHVFLRMLSYYVSFHMANSLAAMLFKDDDQEGTKALQDSPVSPAKRSYGAIVKARSKHTLSRDKVRSFQSLIDDLATVVANRITPKDTDLDSFVVITKPTPIQQRAFELLQVESKLGYM